MTSAGDGEDLIEELIGAKLIFELQSIGSGVRIRSRFAEMMRLLAANRQLSRNKPLARCAATLWPIFGSTPAPQFSAPADPPIVYILPSTAPLSRHPC